MKKLLLWIFIFIIFVLNMLILITPAYTKGGESTNFIQYWTSDSYFEENF